MFYIKQVFDQPISKEIEYILKFLRSVNETDTFNRTMLSICDRKTSDFNHTLELDNPTYKERARLATKQRENLIERRKYKDAISEYQPLVELLQMRECTRFINLLSETLGKVRKQEKQHKNRVYHKRIEGETFET